ncbi:MAG: NTP transferase domain-containing protein [Sedimentisphaerales bacterium]|nr:NTP transferase domain-containing protein [Sedimentisphaerales bacterium]
MKSTLLVLAAGLGTRYGGLKQIDDVGPHGQTLIDYSVYDAIRVGFNRIVFVIRHYFEEEFKEKVSSKFDRFVDTAYAYQEIDACLGGLPLVEDRQKPWGTGHAILVSKDVIDEPFAVMNADDYYGINALKTIIEFISAGQASSRDHAMVGYTLRNTLSEYGSVSRGVCDCDGDTFLKTIVERKNVQKTADGARYVDPDGSAHSLIGDEIVSMNLWGFQPSIFDHLQAQFGQFLRDQDASSNAELLIPSVVDDLIKSRKATVKVLKTEDSWFGVTYRQDKEVAAQCIRKLTDEGLYPEKLWRS